MRRFEDGESQAVAIKAHRLYRVELIISNLLRNTDALHLSSLPATDHDLSLQKDLKLLGWECFYSPKDVRNPLFTGRSPYIWPDIRNIWPMFDMNLNLLLSHLEPSRLSRSIHKIPRHNYLYVWQSITSDFP
jgi:hypothetical protein